MEARDLLRALAVIALPAAAFGVFIAFVTYAFSTGGDGGEPYDYNHFVVRSQLVLSVVGLLAAVAFASFAVAGRRRATISSLVAGVLIWAVWALMNDAAVHGRSAILGRLFGIAA